MNAHWCEVERPVRPPPLVAVCLSDGRSHGRIIRLADIGPRNMLDTTASIFQRVSRVSGASSSGGHHGSTLSRPATGRQMTSDHVEFDGYV